MKWLIAFLTAAALIAAAFYYKAMNSQTYHPKDGSFVKLEKDNGYLY